MLGLASAPAVAQHLPASEEFVAAVKNSNGNKVHELLNAHPQGLVDSRDLEGNTALIVAIKRRDEDWSAFLLNQGANPNLADKSGTTPLIAAARVGFDSAVEWLLGKGARVDAVNRSGETALIAAVQQRSVPVVRLLLAAGADPDRRDSAQGFSARDYAKRDPRARDILALIEEQAKKPAPAKEQKIDDFKLD